MARDRYTLQEQSVIPISDDDSAPGSILSIIARRTSLVDFFHCLFIVSGSFYCFNIFVRYVGSFFFIFSASLRASF